MQISSSSSLTDKIFTILDDAKAEDIKIIDLRNKSSVADYFVISTCRSSRHADATADDLARKLKDLGVKNLVVTIGEGGCILINDDYCEQIEGVKVDVIDSTGAGDAFNAGLAVALSEGMSILDSLKFANCCGAVVCTKYGVVSALGYREEINELFNKSYK